MSAQNTPISESIRVVRETTFHLTHGREDFRDAVAKLILMSEQLHNNRFTGALIVNWSQGSITNATTKASQKINPA